MKFVFRSMLILLGFVSINADTLNKEEGKTFTSGEQVGRILKVGKRYHNYEDDYDYEEDYSNGGCYLTGTYVSEESGDCECGCECCPAPIPATPREGKAGIMDYKLGGKKGHGRNLGGYGECSCGCICKSCGGKSGNGSKFGKSGKTGKSGKGKGDQDYFETYDTYSTVGKKGGYAYYDKGYSKGAKKGGYV